MAQARNVERVLGQIGVWTVLAATAAAISALPTNAQPSYKWGAGGVILERQVNVWHLPQYTPGASAVASPPATGLEENEKSERKKEYVVPPGARLPNAPMALPARPNAGRTDIPTDIVTFDGNVRPRCGDPGASDMALAVGNDLSQYPVLQVNNSCLSVFSKSGKLADGFPKRLDGLFPNSPMDPRAIYDWFHQRYIIVAFERWSGDSHYWIAVSVGNDPGGLYYVYRIPMPSGGKDFIPDFPRLGQDKRAIYIASNKFRSSGKDFQYEEWLLLPKTLMYSGSRFTYKFIYDIKFAGTLTDTTQPANMWNVDEDPGVGLLVASKNLRPGGLQCKVTACNGLLVFAIANPLWDGTGTDPGVSGAAVPTTHDYIVPPMVKQGEYDSPEAIIDPGDTRISGQVSYAGGLLFASLTTGKLFTDIKPKKDITGVAAAMLYKIRPQMYNRQVPMLIGATITDEFALDYGTESSFLATTQPDAEGNTLTVFSLAGPNYYPSTAIFRRGPTFSGETTIVRQSNAPFGNRYALGDYSGVAPDLIGGSRKRIATWFSGQYAGDSNSDMRPYTRDWKTVIGKADFAASPPR
jgi:hypothetical protein